MNTSQKTRFTNAKRHLATAVLAQARRDLRRFSGATRAVERELYLDAYEWIVSESCRWPFSFRNVCKLLSLPPEGVRQELLEDISLGLFHYWSRRLARSARRFPNLIGNAFTRESDHTVETGTLVHGLS